MRQRDIGLSAAAAVDSARVGSRPLAPPRVRRLETALHIVLIALIGIVYRATFITQGFNATDEGWLQSVGRRIVLGQVPYRDFRFAFPPVSIYKEAALEAIFGDAYTVLFSRWIFVGEATVGSVLAYLIMRRFVSPRVALVVTLPTVFFSILMYYFANYTYDAEVLLLASIFLLTMTASGRKWPAFAAGAAACLSTLAKPNYAAFVVLVVGVGILYQGFRMVRRDKAEASIGMFRYWPQFLAGSVVTFVVVLGLFAVAGAARPFLQQAFVEDVGSGAERGIGFAIWQNLPTAFTYPELKLLGVVYVLLIASALQSVVPGWKRFSWVPLTLIPLGLIAYSTRYFQGAAGFIPMGMGLLLVINFVGLLLSLSARIPPFSASADATAMRRDLPPPTLFLLALVMQYLSQFTFTGVIYSYLGAYLSVPVGITLLGALAGPGQPGSAITARAILRAAAPALFGLWIVLASANFIHNYVYFDAPRDQLTAAFQTPKLAGITSTPANVRRIDGVVRLVNAHSQPGDPVLVIQDFAALYFLTDRVNSTSQDWYLTSDSRFLPASEIGAVVAELKRDPPKVVVIQTVSEFDWARSYRPDDVIDYKHSKLAPVYDYLTAHYVVVGTVDDINVLIPINAS